MIMSLLQPQKNKPSHNTQAGNILVYILGALFLLGLLVVMVKGSTSPGAGIDRETLELRVNDVQSYGNELERAVTYVLRNGFSESDIRFAHPNADSAYGDITDTPTRQIFDVQGGGATYREPPEGIQVIPTDWIFTAQNEVLEIGSFCNGGGCHELMSVLMNVTLDFCLLVNDKNEITNPAGAPPQDAIGFGYGTLFDGVFGAGDRTLNDGTGHIRGHSEGCVEGDTDPPAGTYHYYRVLLAR